MMRIKSFIWLLFGIIWQGVVPAFAQQGSSDEKIFFYHHDHLGNTVCVTDEVGEVVQHVEYLPTGEVFIEEKNPANNYATSYKFNGKELDEETGLYYYGARYLHPKYAMWLSTDPMEGKYPNVSSYIYCHDNPIYFIENDGKVPRIYIERQGIGHVFLTIGEGEKTIVYTYGRYIGGDKGKSCANSLDPTGLGVLIRLTGKEAIRYIKHELSDLKASVYEFSDANDFKSKEFMELLYNKGRVLTKAESEKYNQNANKYGTSQDERVIDKYHLLNNNCTTKSITGVKAGGTQEDFLEDGGNVPIPNGPHIMYQPITPTGIDNHLSEKSKLNGSAVKNVTSKMNREFNKK